MMLNNKERYPGRAAKFTFAIIILLAVSFSAVYGQAGRREVPPLKERLFYGGNFGLQFGTYTNIEVSPVIGLWVLPRVGIAAGPDFQYYKEPSFSTTIYGGKTYVEYVFLEDLNNIIPLGVHLGLFLHLEDEALSLESVFKPIPDEFGRFWVNTVLGGGGIRQLVGPRSSLNFTFLWALTDSGYNFYASPEIRISFMF